MRRGLGVKIGLGVSAAVLFLLSCILLAPYAIRIAAKRIIGTGTTVPEATRLVNEVVGTEAINRDLEKIINQFDKGGSLSSRSLSPSQLGNYPAISNLASNFGSYSLVIFVPEGSQESEPITGSPAQIEIRFGSHNHLHFLHVLDWRKPIDAVAITNREPRWTQIASNIFVR